MAKLLLNDTETKLIIIDGKLIICDTINNSDKILLTEEGYLLKTEEGYRLKTEIDNTLNKIGD